MTAKILCLDIERVPAIAEIWDPGDKNYIQPHSIVEPSRTVCFAYQWILGKDDDSVHFSAEWEGNLPQDNTSVTPGGGHKKMMELSRSLMTEADFLVGWNSKKFDVRHLRAGHMLYGLTPASPHVDIDLMLQVRSQSEHMYYRMGVLAKQFGVGGKMDTGGAILWRKLRFAQGDVLRRARRKMKAYNENDVVKTTAAYHFLKPWLRGVNLPLYEDPESDDFALHRCPNCASFNLRKEGVRRTTTRAYQQYQCRDCGKWSRDTKSQYGVVTT